MAAKKYNAALEAYEEWVEYSKRSWAKGLVTISWKAWIKSKAYAEKEQSKK